MAAAVMHVKSLASELTSRWPLAGPSLHISKSNHLGKSGSAGSERAGDEEKESQRPRS